VAKRYLKNTELSEDAVQDIFVKVWTKRDQLNPNLSFEGYLFTALKNHVLNMVRDESRRKKILNELQQTARTEQPAETVDERVIYSDYEAAVDKAISKLSPAKQEVFKLRSIRGLSNDEIAKK